MRSLEKSVCIIFKNKGENRLSLMKIFFKSISISLICLFAFFSYFCWIKKRQGFCYEKIHSEDGYNSRWDFGPPSKRQQTLLDQISCQPFTLLGSGKNCYAFVSDDGKIVVKFFKQKRLQGKRLLPHLPIPKVVQAFRQEILSTHHLKKDALYQSYQIAYERLFEQTGILYLHLTKTKGLNRTIHLKTPKGKSLILELDDLEFLIQKRGFSVFDTMKKYPEKRKKIIVSILDLIVQISQQRIGNRLVNCEADLGVLQEKVIQIGVGKFYPSIRKSLTKEELETKTLPIKTFLETIDPKLIPYLEEQIQCVLC